MESAISAIASELVSRAISFLLNKCADRTATDQKREKMQQLLLRIHAVVEEADGRYITNPKMVTQLKVLAEAMYKGYHALDKSRRCDKSVAANNSFTYEDEEGTTTSSSSSITPPKRSRTVLVVPGTSRAEDDGEVQSVLESLERAAANMTEFVVLLTGCERMCRRPYDTYLYTDTLMFGRHAEKQQIIGTLLSGAAPEAGRRSGSAHGDGLLTVLPVIGGCRVGKKTLVSHACNNDRVRSYFSSIRFIRGVGSMLSTTSFDGRTLAVVEITSRDDVDDDDWSKFCKAVARTAGQGSKVILISRNRSLARLGTVRPVFLNSLSREEYTYLFKRLAFGSSDESAHPSLSSVANEVAAVLGGSLVTANILAHRLRQRLDVRWWLRVARRFKGMVDSNLSKYGEHPKDIFEDERPIDIVDISSSSSRSASATTRRMMPPRAEGGDCPKRKLLVHVPLLDLEGRRGPLPSDEFVLVSWESRIAPYTRYVSDVCAAEDDLGPMVSSRKRRFSV